MPKKMQLILSKENSDFNIYTFNTIYKFFKNKLLNCIHILLVIDIFI